MLLDKFRITHSTLIEHYQYIEAHLEGIYATVAGKSFHEGIKEVEKDSLSGVVREIKEIERERGIRVFSQEEYAQLRQIIERRNFWCHCCYFEMAFDQKTGGPAKVQDEYQLAQDMQTAEKWREYLFNKKVALMKQKERGKQSGI